MLAAAILLLAQSAPAASGLPLIPGPDDVGGAPPVDRADCLARGGDIVVCARVAPPPRKPPLPDRVGFEAAGGEGVIAGTQRGLLQGVSIPAVLLTMTWRF